RVLDPGLPGAPLERPAVTVLANGVACVHQESLDTQTVVLSLPATCGAAGAALSFRYTALDPRFHGTSEMTACAVGVPPLGDAAGYKALPQQATLQPGSTASFGLASDTAVCGTRPAGGTTTPAPTPAAAANGDAATATPPAAARMQPAPSQAAP